MASTEYTQVDKRLAAVERELDKPRYSADPGEATGLNHRGVPTGAPWARKGEDVMNSRPFYFSHLVGMSMGVIQPDRAKHERNQIEWFSKAMRQCFSNNYENENHVLFPICAEMLPETIKDSGEFGVMKAMMGAASQQYDRKEALGILGGSRGVRRASDQSAYDYSLGGTYVPPPEFGEPIELLRNEEVLLKAGAKRIALPPQGSIQYPRLTVPTVAAAQPEGTQGTFTNVNTGDVTLTAKAYTVFLRLSNQLAKFAPALASALLQQDMMKSLGLLIDLDALEGKASGSTRIKGLINYATTQGGNMQVITAGNPSANGDTLLPADLKRVIAKVFSQNAKFNAWVMRFELFLNNISEFRGDAVTANDGKGMYLYDVWRAHQDAPLDFTLLNFPVACSNQVSRTRVKGSGTNLSYLIGGDFNDMLFGMHGALELAINMYGDTAWRTNQQEMRAVGYADAAPRHEASFALIDNLLVTY